VYLNYLCTCSAVLGAADAMDECDKRAIGDMSLFTCIDQIRYPTLGMSKGREREGGGVLGTCEQNLRLHTQRA
jgi:hypothetical protein